MNSIFKEIISKKRFLSKFPSRHNNISVVYLTQNAYYKGGDSAKFGRTTLINASDIVLFRYSDKYLRFKKQLE